MANQYGTMSVVDPIAINDFDDDDDEIVGGDASDLVPIDLNGMDDDDDDANVDYTPGFVNPDDLDKIPEPTPTQESVQEENDIVAALLKSKGISNPREIKFEEEDGSESVKDFYSLTREEQLELLATNDLDDNYGLEENEIDAINYLRENNATLQEVIEYYQQQAIENYKNSTDNTFEIDGFSDEELYVIDLKTKYDDLTNEELEMELTKALETPDLFQKKVDRLRVDYKRLEEDSKAATSVAATATQEEAYTKIANSLIDVANGIDDMYGIDLELADKEDIIASITDRDLNGVTPLVKALDNPANLFKAAWFVNKGEEAFNLLHTYYRKEIEDVRKNSYAKGKSEALRGFPTQPINSIGKSQNRTIQSRPQQRARSIDDLHDIND
jgi:hypothetical protein